MPRAKSFARKSEGSDGLIRPVNSPQSWVGVDLVTLSPAMIAAMVAVILGLPSGKSLPSRHACHWGVRCSRSKSRTLAGGLKKWFMVSFVKQARPVAA